MSPTRREETERLGERYALSGVDAIVAVEKEALGSDYQANGYTTREQADELGRVLELGPGRLLLDIGAGCGWPGLYLAQKHGCTVISLDPVIEGGTVARARALTDGLEKRAWAVRAAAQYLPIRPRSVDAVVHSDVLCWLRQKLSVLSASHRVLRPRGRLAFHVIQPTPGLPAPAKRRAHHVGPGAVAVSTSYEGLLRSAGFTDVSVIDLSTEYASTLGRWIEANERRESAIRKVVGSEAFDERAASRLETLRAIEDGILARTQYTATRL